MVFVINRQLSIILRRYSSQNPHSVNISKHISTHSYASDIAPTYIRSDDRYQSLNITYFWGYVWKWLPIFTQKYIWSILKTKCTSIFCKLH